MYRKSTKKRVDSKIFRRTATRSKAININPNLVSRGGIRL